MLKENISMNTLNANYKTMESKLILQMCNWVDL